MSTQLFVLLLLAVIVVVYLGISAAAYFRTRGKRIVTCPETMAPALVTVDAGHAALTAVWDNGDVQLKTCSRWPERGDCEQPCTAQIAIDPQGTLVSGILKRWYAGRDCAICRRPIGPIHAGEPKPGLLNPATARTLSWADIPLEQLPAFLEGHLPVCSNCDIAETFRRQFPDRITDRAATAKRDLAVH